MATGSLNPDLPVSFGYKCAWYALPTNDMDAVVSALDLRQTVESSWSRGIEEAYSDKVFVTPPLGKWTLAVGVRLWYKGDKPAKSVLPMLTKLSKTFEEAQYFATHRVVKAHCWALARTGKLIRGYAFVGDKGEINWNDGNPTPAELALGEDALEFPDESQLMEIAAAWSVDPSELETTFTQPGHGRLGEVA